LQGNTGTGANWLRPTLANELFKEGQPLDVGRYFIIIPDALGRGGSSKPSDGLKGSFPHYRYHDMVDSVHRLVTEGSRSPICVWSSAVRWAACTVLCGPRCILT
jgi:homoserine O-acetyltransferase